MDNKNSSFDAYLCFCSEAICDYNYKVLHSKNSNTYGIHYIEKCTNVIYSDKNTNLKLKVGHLYLFPSNVEFRIFYENDSKDNYYQHIWFSFISMPGLCDTIVEYNINQIPSLEAILPLIKAGIKDDFLKKPMDLATVRNKMISLILTILNDITPFKNNENDILARVIFYMQQNLNSDVSIEKLSSIAMLNRTYFYKLFTERMKMSPHKYIVELKILKGKVLLKANYKISQIAEETGFSDAKAFSRAFKNHTGYSPYEFKNRSIQFE